MRLALSLLSCGLVWACAPESEPVVDTQAPVPPAVVAVDCDSLAAGPLQTHDVEGSANEDISFDQAGYLMGADNAENLWRVDAEGQRELVLPGSGVTAGLRSMWWDGRLASAQYGTGAIYAIDPITGSKELLLGDLQAPTGIETGLDHSIWFTEIWAGRLSRLHVPTGTVTVMVEGLYKPQGLSFSPDYDILYFAAIGEDRIYALEIDPETMDHIGEPWVFAEGAGDTTDGLGVDACGNIYAGSWGEALLTRFTPEGVGPEVLVQEPGAAHGLGNFAWGAVHGGFDPNAIYVVETGPATVRRVDLGVPEKGRPTL